MQSRYQFILRYLSPFADIGIINLALLSAFYFVDLQGRFTSYEFQKNVVLFANISWMFGVSILGLYKDRVLAKMEEIYLLMLKCSLLHAALFVPYLLLVSNFFAGHFIFIFYLNSGILLLLNRMVGNYAYANRLQYFDQPKKVAVIGKNNTAEKLASFFQSQKNINFYGCLDLANEFYTKKGDCLAQGVIDQLKQATKNGVKLLYASVEPNRMSEISSLVKEAENQFIHLKIVPDFQTSFDRDYKVSYFADQFALVSLRREPLEDIGNRLKKRVFDIIFSSLVILFVLSWLYPILAFFIKMQSPGPVLFKQARSGRDNKPFYCFKFRSMQLNTESDVLQATKGDQRVTKIGRFLRKTSLDELPQFFNVFLGDMSVIGPRPHMVKHTEQYRQIINEFMVRHFLKPGITGWAQVKGYRGETKTTSDMENRVRHDIWYLENWSLDLDLKIVWMTIRHLLKGDENAF